MQEQEDHDRLTRTLGRAYLILCLMYMGWIMWHLLLPDHKRLAMRLWLLRSCARVMSGLAHRTGAASLRQEALTGAEDYWLPYRLSLVRQAAERAYDRARNVSA